MREIKFRGLDEYGIWHYGYFWIAPDGTCFIKEKIDETHSADFEVKPETVGQYTDRKDKNGKEIYEDDILNVDNNKRICKVVWFQPEACFDTEPLYIIDKYSPFQGLRNVDWSSRTEVIGPCCENVTLLKGTK